MYAMSPQTEPDVDGVNDYVNESDAMSVRSRPQIVADSPNTRKTRHRSPRPQSLCQPCSEVLFCQGLLPL